MKTFLKNPDGEYDFGVMSISLTRSIVLVAGASSTSSKTIRYNWSWSAAPLIAKTDSVAVRWQGYDSQGHSIDMTCYSGSNYRYGSIKYYGSSGLAKTESLTIQSYSGFDCLRSNFSMNKSYNGETIWAKSGSLTCKIDKSASGNAIEYVKFQGTYGHSTLNVGTPSIDFSGVIGISFGTGVENYYKTAEIRSSVTYI